MIHFTMENFILCELNLDRSVCMKENIIGNKNFKRLKLVVRYRIVLISVLYTYKVRNCKKNMKKNGYRCAYRACENVIKG